MAVTEVRKTIGKSGGLLFWVALLGSMLLHFAIGGVVVGKKYEKGEYFFSLREQPSIWVETNAALYYLNILQPWFLGTISIILVVSFIQNYYGFN